jgi:hypothetical protein
LDLLVIGNRGVEVYGFIPKQFCTSLVNSFDPVEIGKLSGLCPEFTEDEGHERTTRISSPQRHMGTEEMDN